MLGTLDFANALAPTVATAVPSPSAPTAEYIQVSDDSDQKDASDSLPVPQDHDDDVPVIE
jgi:hypothetical protein